VVDHVRDRVDALLDGEGEAVVLGADELGDALRGGEVGRALEADREGLDRLKLLAPPRAQEALALEPKEAFAALLAYTLIVPEEPEAPADAEAPAETVAEPPAPTA